MIRFTTLRRFLLGIALGGALFITIKSAFAELPPQPICSPSPRDTKKKGGCTA